MVQTVTSNLPTQFLHHADDQHNMAAVHTATTKFVSHPPHRQLLTI